MLKFDPNFVQPARKERKMLGSPQQQLEAQSQGFKGSEDFCGDAIDQPIDPFWFDLASNASTE